mgnify:CR=1 FL=1
MYNNNVEKNEQEIKNSIINEVIANYIINKSISIAINTSTLKEIYEKINLHCYNYLKKLINSYLLIEFIPHEDTPNSSQSSDNNIFYNMSKPSKSNTWTYISEPESAIIDRCSNRNLLKQTNHRHLYQINNDENDEFKEENININNSQLLNIESLKKKTIIHTKTLKNEQKSKMNENVKSKDENNDEELYKNYKVIKKKKFVNIKGLLTIKEDRIIEMPSYDIKDKKENFNVHEKEEINKLRKEYQYLMEQKKRKSNLILAKSSQKKSRINLKFFNNFDSNRFTFDTNGKILNLNLPKLSPISNEFNTPKQKVIDKDINNSDNNNTNNVTNKRKSINYKKPIISSFEKYNLNINSDDTKRKSARTISTRNKTIRNRTSSLPNKNIANNTNNFYTKRNIESIEYNPRDLKITLNKNKDKYSKFKKAKIIGGPNFEKFVPEVGVVIHDDNKLNKTKRGGFKYSNKYSKMSFKELSQIIDNKGKYSSVDNPSLSFNQDYNNNNYNGYNEKFNDNNNPLLENAHSIENKERILSSFSENRNKSNINNNYNSIDISCSLNKIDMKRNMKYSLSKNSNEMKILSKVSNMKLSSDNYINNIYDLLRDEQKDIISSSSIDRINKSKGLISIKEIINIKRKLPSIEDLIKKKNEKMKGRYIINNFNYNIIKSKDWGNKFSFNNKNENNRINLKNNIFRKEKYKKLKINDDNNHNKLSNLGRNNLRKQLFSSSSTGALFP